MVSLKEYDIQCCKLDFWIFVISCVVLVSLAGITSGLALGLLSFSHVDLEVLIKAGRPNDRKNAERILPFVKNDHFVLCTLLLGKSLAMEALPIFMGSIMRSWLTIISTPLVTIFAEIVPQAVFSRYGLTLGAKMAPFVQMLLLIFFPISYPASKVLDLILGKEHSGLLRRSELKTFVDLHANEAGKGGELSYHETSIITGAMDWTQKTAKEAMTPISETFSLDINSKLDMNTMTLIMSKGHSRVPLHSRSPSNIVGLNASSWVYENWPLYEILNQFQKGHSHMAVVLKGNKDTENTTYESSDVEFHSPKLEKVMELDNEEHQQSTQSLPTISDEEVIGIITMEDVMEELLQGDILDETDEYVHVQKNIRVNFLHSQLSSRKGSESSLLPSQRLSRKGSESNVLPSQITSRKG